LAAELLEIIGILTQFQRHIDGYP